MSRRILVVDDERDILDLARIILKSGGYDVMTTTSGEEALRIISMKKPDLVLLDVVLPGVSGLDVCRLLKRDPGTRSIKVVLFTALGTEVDMMLEKKADLDTVTELKKVRQYISNARNAYKDRRDYIRGLR